VSGQFKLDTTDSAPDGMATANMDDALKIKMIHACRTEDSPEELASLDLLFEG